MVKRLPLDNAEQLQLPIWPQTQRGMPNALARSALFAVGNIRTGERQMLRRHLIASLDGIRIEYTGDELRQDDADVWMQITHLARLHPLGVEVEFVAHAMLRELGWQTNAASYERLRNCLDRLKATSLTISLENGTRGYSGSLIRLFSWRDDHGEAMRRWRILLEKPIADLFGANEYTRLDWALRLQLPPLAKWLHLFYLGHTVPYRYKVETLQRLCGSKQKYLRNFRADLRRALDTLIEARFLREASICARTDLVAVERAPRAVQA